MKRAAILVTALALTLTGCAATDSGRDDAAISQADLLAAHGLEGKDAREIITELDQTPRAERSTELMASIRIDELILSDDTGETSLPMPEDETYMSIAPYVNQTHDCFYHSLTTCTGELGNEPVHVTFRDDAGEAILDEEVTTYDNGFVGFWVPKGATGTIEVDHEGRTATADFSTEDDGATCVTTLQLT
ncbi:CueP family metal-binding protein [Corynebacterium guangdongense]|uniref:CueP family metal-binding protein n=1 Tax=Corynebacterium guangdongense TaxID=1783348 RepID=A0ABU2A0D7_9CORY|nr:CueP family metal-binding protein [Corynebacterium guangdongense]MDR7330646.1 hypothetical protein [Corynebacterium guangdongense]WJZ16662.1 hypothetical protein CGUA_00265 [Corynebacterium guangdongense]